MNVQTMNTTFAQQCGVYSVITSQGGRQIFENCHPQMVQALVTIANNSRMEFPQINKFVMVSLIKTLLEIHNIDSQTINAYQLRANQLQRKLELAETQTAACHQVQHQRGQSAPAMVTPATSAAPKKEVTGRVDKEDKQCQISNIGYGTTPYLTRSIDVEVQCCKEMNEREETCIFFRRGACIYGPSGTNDKGSCRFAHPTVCARFEIFGAGKLGCQKGSKCKQLHRTLCKLNLVGKCQKSKKNCGYYHLPQLEKRKGLELHPMGLRRRQEGGQMLDKDERAHDNDIIWTLVKLMELSYANKSCNGCGFKKKKY